MNNTKVYVVVLLIRFIYAGMHILTKAAFDAGTSTSVFVFYRHALAALFLAPIAFFLERGRAPPLTYKLSFKIFLHAFYGMAGTINLYSFGLNYASATSSAAIFNIVPVVAFIFAVLFRMETMNMKSIHGAAKASGILLCVAGVLVLAMYQGPEFQSFNHHQPLHHASNGAPAAPSAKNWALGVFLMTSSVVIWALWTVLQGPLLEEYPSKLLNTTLQCIFASVQSFLIALVLERDFSRWKLGRGVSLFAVFYTGIIVAAISYYLQIWVIAKRGPVFLSISMPLSLIITMVISSFLLGEPVSLGSILGGVLLVAGLYNVLWGKSKEERVMNKEGNNGEKAVAQESEEKENAVAPATAQV